MGTYGAILLGFIVEVERKNNWVLLSGWRTGYVLSGLHGICYLFHRGCNDLLWFQTSNCVWLSILSMVTVGVLCITVIE